MAYHISQYAKCVYYYKNYFKAKLAPVSLGVKATVLKQQISKLLQRKYLSNNDYEY